MPETVQLRMPTGISTLDPILDGGVPPGSLILLLGEMGAGNYEFVYSSIVNTFGLMKDAAPPGLIIPKKIQYVTFTRMKEDVMHEIVQSFRADKLSESISTIQFDDLSEFYFDRSIVPDGWYSRSDTLTRLQKRSDRENIFLRMSNVFNAAEKDSIVILDSITDIATQTNIPNLWADLTGILRGVQRLTKQRNITTYLLLTKGILDSVQERELADIADAVLLFKWEESASARRQRVMYFEKFRGVMPHLEEQDLVKFAVRISTTGGFEVSNIRVVI
jgi:KaiC/GvpD/RAD55 family RecA-like ATPase